MTQTIARILAHYLAFSPKSAPIMMATRYQAKYGAWPAELVYPPDSPVAAEASPVLTHRGIAIVTDSHACNLAYAGPRPEDQ